MNALVTDLQPDKHVLNAMNQIESQRRMRMAAQEKAEGEKILIVKAAEADAEYNSDTFSICALSVSLTPKASLFQVEAPERAGRGAAAARDCRWAEGVRDGLQRLCRRDNAHGRDAADDVREHSGPRVAMLMNLTARCSVRVTQYLDMLKEVGTKDQASTVFIPHAPGAVGDIQSQMRQGFMEANAMATAQTRPTVARPSA